MRAGLTALTKDGAASGSPADYLAHDRYIVYGHSCGAFLAYQLWTEATGGSSSSSSSEKDKDRQPPCIVGLEGIYDLRGFVERGGSPEHGGGPGTGFAAALETIAEGAFGDDRAVWDRASPARYDFANMRGSGSAPRGPLKPRLAVLAYSPEDELVDGGEMDSMETALQQGAAQSSGGLVYVGLRDLHGRHDEIHEDGREVARVLTEAVRQLDQL